MSTPLDGIISCKGFAYNICNKNTAVDNQFIRLGTISGVTGSHIKIECLLGNSNIQGTTQPENKLPLPSPTVNAPILLTIYGSFHNNSSIGDNAICNFEGFYTVVGNATTIEGVFVEHIYSQFSYCVYIKFNSLETNLNYFVYLPNNNNCTWVNDGTARNGFEYSDPAHWYEYPKL